jgi:hypothetical protein
MLELVAMGLDELLEDDLEPILMRRVIVRFLHPPKPRLPPAQEPVVLADQLPVLVVFGSTYRHFIPRVELGELRAARLADELSEDGLGLLLVLQLESNRVAGGKGHRVAVECIWVPPIKDTTLGLRHRNFMQSRSHTRRGLTPPQRVAAVIILLAPTHRAVVAQAALVAERMVGEVPYLAGVDTLVKVLRHLRHSAKRLGVQVELVDDLLEQGAREHVHGRC